jgi:hypothetical protein
VKARRDGSRVLIVGAGAVGQVFGLAHQRGGAHVGVRVREAHRPAAEAGYPVWPAGNAKKRPVRFLPDAVLTTDDAVVPGEWDEIWLCMSSTALWRGDWLESLLARAGDATIVTLQPGLETRARMLEHVPEERLIQGLIAFSAWHGPLAGDQGPEALWWWLPPFQSNLVAGPWPLARRTTKRLRRGGLAAQATTPLALARTMATGNAALLSIVAALEVNGWSFAALRSGPWASRAARAARQSITIAAAHRGEPPPGLRHLIRGWTLGLLSRLAPLFTPFHFERFLEAHFTKVGDQTRIAMLAHRDQGRTHSLPTGAIDALMQALAQVDADEGQRSQVLRSKPPAK